MADVVMIPAGAVSVDILRGDEHEPAAAGGVRSTYTTGATTLAAPERVEVTAGAVTAPGAAFVDALATLAAVTVAGDSRLADIDTPTVAVSGVATNALAAVSPEDDLMTVTAAKIVLNADVQVLRGIDTASASDLSVRDTTLRLGAVDVDGDDVTDLVDTLRDGAGLVVPGAPQHLPAGLDADAFQHALRWEQRAGDFSAAGAPLAPHQRPAWRLGGGGLSIAAPDAGDRVARFLFAPTFTADEAALDMYYAAGGESTLVASFTTEPFPAAP